jgi:hypothetical protein
MDASNPMNTELPTITRREVLLRALKSTVVASAAAPVVVQAAPYPPTSPPESEFVPDNDYPFFGYEPEPFSTQRPSLFRKPLDPRGNG